MMRAHLRLNQVGTAIFSHKHTPLASHQLYSKSFLFNNTTQQMSFTQMKSHSLAKSKGTAMTDLVSPKLSWVYILSSMFNVSSMINDVAPKQPPTMAPCLQPINGTAQLIFCVFNQQRYSYHTSTIDAHRPCTGAPATIPTRRSLLPEPTYMELHPTTIGIRRTIGVPWGIIRHQTSKTFK